MRTDSRPGGRTSPSFIERARREQIMAATAETVAELGYGQASLARIAERAGVSKSVISYHFDGKDELLLEMVSGFFERAWEHIEEQLAVETTAAGRIRAWVGAQMEFLGAHRTEFIAMCEIAGSHRLADGSRPFAEGEREELDAIAEILREGQGAGEFRDFDAESVATIIVQATEGVLGRWSYDDDVDLGVQTSALLDFIDHAIRGEGS